jgi:hypothetical protein
VVTGLILSARTDGGMEGRRDGGTGSVLEPVTGIIERRKTHDGDVSPGDRRRDASLARLSTA